MIAEIVSIGTELLMGQIVNTDAQYLSRRLNALGISVYYHTTVGDNPGRMEQTLRLALSRSDVVITTGGLGPTGDDLSKEIVARLFGLPMERDEESMRRIEGYFSAMHRDMTHNNERQAMFARGAIILQNDRGTAPGCIVEQDGKAVIQLPGPPYELTDMFEKRVLPYLARRTGGAIASRYIRIFGVGESDAETRVKDLIDAQTDVTIAPYCSLGEVQLRVSARGGKRGGGARAHPAHGRGHRRAAGRRRLRRQRRPRRQHGALRRGRAHARRAHRRRGRVVHGRTRRRAAGRHPRRVGRAA